MAKTKLSADERFAIHDLFARYAWAYDCCDSDAYVDTFTPDGVIQAVDGGRHEGRDAIRVFAATYFHQPGFPGTQHHSGPLLFERDEVCDCVVRNYWLSLQWNHESGLKFIKNMGYYVSRCVSVDGVWFFEERIMRLWDRASLPWKGPAFESRAAGSPQE